MFIVQRGDPNALAKLESLVLSHTVQQVLYHRLDPVDQSEIDDGLVSDVLDTDTVELVTDGGSRLRLSWHLQGAVQALAIDEEPFSNDVSALETWDATSASAWESVVNRPIIGLRLAWHEVEAESPAVMWALTLGGACGEGATVALGEETVDGRLVYLPDSLVVLEPPMAKTHKSAGVSAWGEPI